MLLLQERDAKIAELEEERNTAVEVVTELIKELPPESIVDMDINEHPHRDPDPILPHNVQVVHTYGPDPSPIVTQEYNKIAIPDFGITEDSNTTPVNAGFGTNFPTAPEKGDMFLRVDYLPSKLYKWNEKKWIEVDKTKTDSFAYDQAYIQHLIEKIDSGEYDVDLLSVAEQEQISRYLQNGNIG